MPGKKPKKSGKRPGTQGPSSPLAALLRLDSCDSLPPFWPDSTARNKQLEANPPASALAPDERALSGIVACLEAGVRGDTAALEVALESLSRAAATGSESALGYLAWFHSFLVPDREDPALFEGVASAFSRQAWPKRLLGLHLLRAGDKTGASAAFEECATLTGGGPTDLEIAAMIRRGETFSPGAGVLFSYPDFGNLHHPPKSPHESLAFNLFILEQCRNTFSENGPILFESALHAYFLDRLETAQEILDRYHTVCPRSPDSLALRGLVVERLKRPEEAATCYRQALELEPGHPLALTKSAEEFLRQGSPIQAEDILIRVLETAPEYPEAISRYASLLSTRASQNDRALDLHRKAIQLDPDVPEYRVQYCMSCLRTGHLDKLQTEWNVHSKYIPPYSEYASARRLIQYALTSSDDPFQIVAVSELLIKNGFPRSAAHFVVRGWKRSYDLEAGRRQEFLQYIGMQASLSGVDGTAAEAYRRLESEEGSGSASLMLALALDRMEKSEEALEAINRCRDESSRSLLLMANVLWRQGEPDSALEHLNRAVQTPDADFLALYNGVKYALMLRRPEAAQDFYSIGEKKWPASPQLPALRAEIAYEEGSESQSLEFLVKEVLDENGPKPPPKQDHILRMHEDVSAPYYTLACLWIAREQYDRARKLLEWLMEHFPFRFGEWQMLSAEILRRRGRPEDALKSLSPANTISHAYLTAALCLTDLGQWKEVLKHLEALEGKAGDISLEIHPSGPGAVLYFALLALAHRNNGDFEEAAKYLQWPLKIRPDHPLVVEVSKSLPAAAPAG